MPRCAWLAAAVAAARLCAQLARPTRGARARQEAALQIPAAPVWLLLLTAPRRHNDKALHAQWRLLDALYKPGRGSAQLRLARRHGIDADVEQLQAQLPRVLAHLAPLLPLEYLATAAACLLRAYLAGIVRPLIIGFRVG